MEPHAEQKRAWGAFCAKLGKRGVARAPHEGPRDYATRAAAALPAAGEAIRVSLGWTTQPGDIDRFVEAWTKIYDRTRRREAA